MSHRPAKIPNPRIGARAVLMVMVSAALFSCRQTPVPETPVTLKPQVFQSGFTWSLSGDTAVPAFNDQDSPAGILKDGSDLWYVYSTGGSIWRTYKGTTLDNLTLQASFSTDNASTNGFTRPKGDDAYWIQGLWKDPSTGTWYAPVHIEFHYGSPNLGYNHFRRTGLATSMNQGVTWTFREDILSSPNPVSDLNAFAGSYFDFGVGDPRFFVDSVGGYFYLIWLHEVFNKVNGQRYLSQRISRSPISSKMAAGSWRNWYKGAWAEPGLGGLASDLNMPNVGNVAIFYSSYLGKFVQIGFTQDKAANIKEGVISSATSMDTQNWTALDRFSDASRIQWYTDPVDSNTLERMSIGQTLRLYSASNSVVATSKYMTVTLGNGTSTGWTAPGQEYPINPVESVRDGNPGWQTDPTPAAPTLSSVIGTTGGLTLTWSAVNGATGYKIEYSTASGSYERAIDVGAVTNFTLSSLKTNTRYYVRVMAFTGKAFGDFSSEGSALTLGSGTQTNDTDTNLVYTGSSWTYHPNRGLGDYQDDVHATSTFNESVSYTFTGTGIDYISEKSTDQGDVDVYLCDGAGCSPSFQQTVSGYTSGARQLQQVLYSKAGLASGSHTIKLVKKTGTVLVLDAFKVQATATPALLNDTDTNLVYTGGSWTYHPNRGLGDYQDDVHATSILNESVSYTFTGMGIDYISEKSTDQGDVDVYLCDGAGCSPSFQQTVSGYTSGARQLQQVLYSKAGLASGSHTIKLVKKTGTVLVLDALKITP